MSVRFYVRDAGSAVDRVTPKRKTFYLYLLVVGPAHHGFNATLDIIYLALNFIQTLRIVRYVV